MPIPLRADFDARIMRSRRARRSKDWLPGCWRLWRWRRFTTARVLDRGRRRSAGVTLQIVRDWVMKFNAHGPEGPIDCKPPGQPSRLNGAHRVTLAAMTKAVARSRPCMARAQPRIVDLCQWIFDESWASSSPSRHWSLGNCAPWGHRKLPARPRHHEQAEGAIEDFKSFPARLDEIGREKGVELAAIEVWFADEARIGQKEQDHPPLGQARHASERADGPTNRLGLYLRRDLPQARKGCSLDHAQMQHGGHEPAPGRNRRSDRAGRAHAALLVDQAGWHLSEPARHAAQHHLDPVAG